jgi:hypothetical protein
MNFSIMTRSPGTLTLPMRAIVLAGVFGVLTRVLLRLPDRGPGVGDL